MKYLFLGPGEKLIIPLKWVDYPKNNCPICKRNIKNKVNRYTGSNNPNIWAMPHGYIKKLEIPFASWFELEPKPRLLRKGITMKEWEAVKKKKIIPWKPKW